MSYLYFNSALFQRINLSINVHILYIAICLSPIKITCILVYEIVSIQNIDRVFSS